MKTNSATMKYALVAFQIGLSCYAKNWKQVKEDYKITRAELEKQGIPEAYQLKVNSKMVSSPGTPELGINIHHMDEKVIADLNKAGIKYTRQTIYWYKVEKSTKKGLYNSNELKRLDKLVNLYKKYDIHPVFVVHGNAPGCSFAKKQAAYRRFADFMAMLAARYKYVKHWQLWNEMDKSFTDLFGARSKTPLKTRGEYYAEMLKLAYPAIKKANPKALVLTGGIVDWTKFPTGIYEGGGKNYFDIMCLHTYGVPLIWSFVTRGAELRQIMTSYGDENKPLWCTEFGVSAGALVKAWGIPKEDAAEYFDRRQKEMIGDCIEFNRKAGVYQKYFPYVYRGRSECRGKVREKIIKALPKGSNLDDYSYSMVRSNGSPRPSMQYLYDSKPNRINKNKRRKLTSATKEKFPPSPRIKITNGQIMRGKQPFFPLGFVFGRNEEILKKSKAVGMNSVHQEYSIRDLFPTSTDKVSSKGLRKINFLHELTRQNNMTFFPLLTGHYIPKWLSRKAGLFPVDVNGNKIGLWFKFSIHDPVFRSTLEKFWTVVAKEVGSDPNVGAFVTWNEPAYGLDATPAGLTAYRSAMKKKYKSIDKFNQTMNTSFKDFASIVPPTEPEPNRTYWYHWFCYNQEAFAEFFAWQRRIFKKYAPEANLSGKHPVSVLTGDAFYCNDIVLQAGTQDIYGCDAYNGSLYHYRDVMEAARSLNPAGPVITYETHGQRGIPPVKPQHAALQMFVQVLGGCRGLFFFCSSPDPRFGFFTDKATSPAVRAAYTKLFKLINKNQDVFSVPVQKADIAVLLSNPSTIHYGGNPDSSKRGEYTKRLSQTYDLIRNQHYAVDFIADRQLKDKLMNYKLLVIPSLSILTDANLKRIEDFIRKGGKIIAFGKSFERDEFFKERPVPAILGLKKRSPAPWNRSQMRLVEAAPELQSSFLTEIIVQAPERVNPAPMKQLIPGYIPETTLGKHIWLAANQDAYPSIIQSTDKQIVYCAFDSLYSEGLSTLIGGIIDKSLGIHKCISVKRKGGLGEAIELVSSICKNDDKVVLMFANCGPNAGSWDVNIPSIGTAEISNIINGKTYSVKQSKFTFSLPGYGYTVYVIRARKK